MSCRHCGDSGHYHEHWGCPHEPLGSAMKRIFRRICVPYRSAHSHNPWSVDNLPLCEVYVWDWEMMGAHKKIYVEKPGNSFGRF